MPTIDVSDIVSDPDFAESFTLLRSTGGAYDSSGEYQDSKTSTPMYGVIEEINSDDLDQVPEGDRIMGAITVWSPQQMNATSTAGISDIVVWHGQNWRVAKTWDRSTDGFWKAIAVRMSGE